MAVSRVFTCGSENLARFLDEIRGFGIRVEGDAAAGRLIGDTPMGQFEGTYAHDAGRLTLTVTQKPALVPDSFLESRLDELARRYGME